VEPTGMGRRGRVGGGSLRKQGITQLLGTAGPLPMTGGKGGRSDAVRMSHNVWGGGGGGGRGGGGGGARLVIRNRHRSRKGSRAGFGFENGKCSAQPQRMLGAYS